MTLLIIGGGELAQQAARLAQAAGMDAVIRLRADACPQAEYILPATEDDAVLRALPAAKTLFDPAAWALTASRLASDAFLRAHDIPIPAYFPEGSEPYLVKPDRGSFGQGIWVTEDFCEVGGAVNAGFVAQEELSGDVWSQVVLGKNGQYRAYAPARLSFDSRRRRTDAVCDPAPDADALAQTAQRIARDMKLSGVLEVEAIFTGGVWKIVDLNARLPMLTPDAVLSATGKNLLTDLCAL